MGRREREGWREEREGWREERRWEKERGRWKEGEVRGSVFYFDKLYKTEFMDCTSLWYHWYEILHCVITMLFVKNIKVDYTHYRFIV